MGNMRPRVLGLRARHEKRASECDDDRDHIPSPVFEHNEFLQNFIVTRFSGLNREFLDSPPLETAIQNLRPAPAVPLATPSVIVLFPFVEQVAIHRPVCPGLRPVQRHHAFDLHEVRHLIFSAVVS